MTYQTILPLVFPWKVLIPEDKVEYVEALLVQGSERCPNGSSFAITSDTFKQGYRWLWMSQASFEYLKAHHDDDLLHGNEESTQDR